MFVLTIKGFALECNVITESFAESDGAVPEVFLF